MPVLETLAERMGVQGLGAQLIEDSPLFAGRRKRSEPGRLPMSRSPSLDHVYSHAGDPLAVLQFDDDVPAPEFIMPFANGRVTSLFNQGRVHPAIDLAGKLGSPVLATTSRQKVIFAGPRGGYGNAVITQDVYGRTHLYGHLQRITSRVGQMLDQGDKLGQLGSTGHSTGPHVHYEVRNSRGTHINPVTLLFPGRGVGKGYAWLDVRQQGRPARVVAGIAGQPRPR
jgi:murein DD-endopeptidase MepM/ murein hydrolase activator NlpD